jgi:hypothetical protein
MSGLRSTPTTSSGGTGITSLAVNAPTNMQPGDVILLMIAANTSTVSLVQPSGFVQLVNINTINPFLVTYSKIATSSEPATYTFTSLNSGLEYCIICAAYKEAVYDTAGNLSDGSTGQANTTTANATGPTRTSTRKGDLIIHMCSAAGLRNLTPPSTNPGAYTLQSSVQSSSAVSLFLSDTVMTTIGATGAPVGTLDSAVNNAVTTFALRSQFEEGNSVNMGYKGKIISASGGEISPNFSNSTTNSSGLKLETVYAEMVYARINSGSIGNVTGGSTAVFKMTGWYAIGSVWETWTSEGEPDLNPPSGHSLSFVRYTQIE